MRSRVVLACAVLVALAPAAVRWFARSEDPQRPPAHAGSPRSVDAPSEAPPRPILLGRPLPPPPAEPTPTMRAKLEEAEQALTKAMALHDQGVLSLRELEQRELELDEARYAARAIDLPTLHARRAQSFARELERLQQLFLQGVVSDAEVQRARAFVAYERFRAGGSRDDYVAARQACRSWMEARDAALARAGAVSVKQLERDLAELEKTVPDPDVPGER